MSILSPDYALLEGLGIYSKNEKTVQGPEPAKLMMQPGQAGRIRVKLPLFPTNGTLWKQDANRFPIELQAAGLWAAFGNIQ